MARDREEETVELYFDVKRDLDKSWLVTDGDKDYFLPKSRCQQNGDDPRLFVVPRWLAEREGMV